MEGIKNAHDTMEEDFANMLHKEGITYTENGYYWQIGKSNQVQGWILHITVIRCQILQLIKTLLPVLRNKNIPFNIVKDLDIAGHLLDGSLGYQNIGKIITVYPQPGTEEAIARDLIDRTTKFRGPEIPTDLQLGNIIYTRYGSINPVLKMDNSGRYCKHIYSSKGTLYPDPYDIPFKKPADVQWPFNSITRPTPHNKPKLLNKRYYPLTTLKPDVKGRVIRAIYFERPYRLKICLIKEGIKNMIADEQGRDIQDRLKWQLDLYRLIGAEINHPKVFDYFHQEKNAYLSMQYVNAPKISDWLNDVFKGKPFYDLSKQRQKDIVKTLQDILEIIRRIHDKGFIHRDITPENFLIDKNKKIWVIDMELAYSVNDASPLPPFKLGTPGFMSPEQESALEPDYPEDIYGIGATMIAMFTNMPPNLFDTNDPEHLESALSFLTGEPSIALLITQCLSKNPKERPFLNQVISLIQTFQSASEKEVVANPKQREEKISENMLDGLFERPYTSELGYWISSSLEQETNIGNRQLSMHIYPFLEKGMAGPLLIAAEAAKYGLNIEKHKYLYLQNLDKTIEYFYSYPKAMPIGLYIGKYGVAMSLSRCIKSGLLENNEHTQYVFNNSLYDDTQTLDLSTGIAGQGLSLLHCHTFLDGNRSKSLLKNIASELLDKQEKNGLWNLPSDKPKTNLSLGTGQSGILLFLLECFDKHHETAIQLCIEKSLSSILAEIRQNAKKIPVWGFEEGLFGMMMVFMRAFDIFKNPAYKQIVQDILNGFPEHPLQSDLSYSSGLVGLGEILLDAYQSFNNDIWLKRADWIAELLIHLSAKNETGSRYWRDLHDLPTADLFSGAGAIYHFLLRNLHPNTSKNLFKTQNSPYNQLLQSKI